MRSRELLYIIGSGIALPIILTTVIATTFLLVKGVPNATTSERTLESPTKTAELETRVLTPEKESFLLTASLVIFIVVPSMLVVFTLNATGIISVSDNPFFGCDGGICMPDFSTGPGMSALLIILMFDIIILFSIGSVIGVFIAKVTSKTRNFSKLPKDNFN